MSYRVWQYNLSDLEYARKRLMDRTVDLALKASSNELANGDIERSLGCAKASIEILDAVIAEKQKSRIPSRPNKARWSRAGLFRGSKIVAL
jgi:hypothetical protein